MSNWESHVLTHSGLMPLAENLWQVTGRLSCRAGNLPRNMVVYRLKDGGLLIHSAIALNDHTMAELEKLGRPTLLMVPNRMHRLDARVYRDRYPKIKVICPRVARPFVEPKVPVDALAEDELPLHGIHCHTPDGVRPAEICLELDVGGGKALVFTDLLFNMKHQPGLAGFITKLLGSSGFFGMTGIGRLLLLKDRARFRSWLESLSRTPRLKVLCVGHGDSLTSNCAEKLREAAARL